jgi:hypothetical protein
MDKKIYKKGCLFTIIPVVFAAESNFVDSDRLKNNPHLTHHNYYGETTVDESTSPWTSSGSIQFSSRPATPQRGMFMVDKGE